MQHLPSPFLAQPKPMPMTIERVEAALDKLAAFMVAKGDDAAKYLPLYDRIEQELSAMRAGADRMAAVRERVRQSTARAAETSIQSGIASRILPDRA